MKPSTGKAAVAAYKERKTFRHLRGQVQRIRADLGRPGGRRRDNSKPHLVCPAARRASTNTGLQGAWNSYGGDRFIFEELERLDEEALSYVRDRRLKERLVHWCSLMGAQAI